jgi:protein-L-isoaspartate O-methyltransferase
MVEKEIKMAKINSDDLVLVIGCGSLPTTTVLISMKTGANVVSVDVDKKSIRDAAQYIKNLHLGDKIKLKHANGLNYSVKNFDVIFVLYGITKQEEMLE